MIEIKDMEIMRLRNALQKCAECLDDIQSHKETQRMYGRELIGETDPVYRYELEQRMKACDEEVEALVKRYGDNLLDAIMLPEIEAKKEKS